MKKQLTMAPSIFFLAYTSSQFSFTPQSSTNLTHKFQHISKYKLYKKKLQQMASTMLNLKSASFHNFLQCSPPTLFTYTSKNTNSITFTTSFSKKSSAFSKTMASATPAAAPTTFGFKNLMETFTVDVHRAENRTLNVPLIAPFTIASTRLGGVRHQFCLLLLLRINQLLWARLLRPEISALVIFFACF
ncbi:unnamed protein product [Lupinus luteus]|uniref:Uncharacterized protein n=1 Tax=Lupinus luteus TaxID=3873 RepID=A0AAV1XV50_LUPLU